jgi:hypothetical protein
MRGMKEIEMSDNPTEGWSLEARLRFEAETMRLAPSGQDTPGTFHLGNWQDKPHRVLYDACRMMEEAADEIASLETREKICQGLVLLHQGDRDRAVSGLDAALLVLREIQDACLYVDDDDAGTVRVTEEPHLGHELFDRICSVLNKHRLSKCPTCGSYNPQLYPAGQAYGRLPTCQHHFHETGRT